MDLFYTQTITVWNKAASGVWETETWYPTVIDDVHMIVSRGNNIIKSGNASADACRVHIDDTLSRPDKPYVDPVSWRSLEDKSTAYTLDESDDTFFTEGDTSQEEPTDSFFEVMKRKHHNCYHISNVDRYDIAIPHFEVWGK